MKTNRAIRLRGFTLVEIMTLVILGVVWLYAPLGIGIVSGLVLYQIVFVINVMRVVANQGGFE